MNDEDEAFIRGGPLPRDLATNPHLRAAVMGVLAPLPEEIRRGANGWTDCYSHGREPVTDDTFIVCFECGHAWTRDALEEANYQGQLESADSLIMTWPDDPPHITRRQRAEDIFFCPECIHDF